MVPVFKLFPTGEMEIFLVAAPFPDTIEVMEKEVSVHEFEQVIKQKHECLSALHSRKFLHENLAGQSVWHGEVLTFDLLNHPISHRCYAWAVDGRVTVVLHEGPVDSPEAAVRETIGAEHPRGPIDP